MCLLGFVCRSINLQIFTEISRFFYISLQIFGVLRLRGLNYDKIEQRRPGVGRQTLKHKEEGEGTH